ncbi:phosphoribosylformylglycinamidine synthase [uncultured Oscillibacter sp.]|uniref:phosphoribosylformylglycinamidine synthase n=1 Tax=uncultured Oscillibacter sp. TaxID=876091 RepID=UPI0025DC7D4B|nr:phosphoribosylformylglycinamidine synthase [uncultured Oscillibacter sp.]
MVYRVFVEKRPGLAPECASLLADCRSFLGLTGLERVRIWNRYDAEGLDAALFERAKRTVFSEPQLDLVSDEADTDGAAAVFAVEPLPGQFDQRSDSAAQCIQLLSQGERPAVRSARVYALYGALTPAQVEAVKRYVINPVESREAAFEKPAALTADPPRPGRVERLTGFTALDGAGLAALLEKLGLAMDLADLQLLQTYFRDEERRDPTMTEIRIVDTYWSDHCRHTTFSTRLDSADIQDEAVRAAYDRYLALRDEVYGEKAASRPQTLMDIATIGTKALKKRGLLPELDESEEINACSIHVPAEIDGKTEDWLLLFKNETHNHPTEIEPFGGAATCIGGCIRDPLSGRAYVHQAMRVTGGADPRRPLSETLPGKLPQRRLAQTAAAGYSSYGNQIGLATGHVAEVYHDGYAAKRLECGAVVAAAPAANVVRSRPAPGDVVLLLGGRTGRDGVGGATGSSKSHDLNSLTTMASEVQKGNAPEERKLQRLFRRGEVTRLIKRCNDFGAGGVAVAVGELADGLEIDLDAVRKKYEGLDGTELAISESQERMAVVVAPEDEAALLAAAAEENLEAYRVAVVTQSPRMVMHWQGDTVADLSRAFLSTNGAVRHTSVQVCVPAPQARGSERSLRAMAGSLRSASRRGLAERFDSTIGAGTVLMPFGGRRQATPAQAMAALLPVLPGHSTQQASVMAWGFDPDQMSADPYAGARGSIYTSVAKLAAAGADYRKAYLSLQEFFEKLRNEPARWGKPFAALLGALDAQMELGAAAIGGKDSMSGSFLDRDVPPTLISFAVAPVLASQVLSPEFKAAEHPVYLFSGKTAAEQTAAWDRLRALAREGRVAAAWAVENGLAEAVMKMSFGNEIGFTADEEAENLDWYAPMPGAIAAELTGPVPDTLLLGTTTAEAQIALGGDCVSVAELRRINDGVLEDVYPTGPAGGRTDAFTFSCAAADRAAPAVKTARPRALIPVFPGTNCEYDTQRALLAAGAEAQPFVVRNLTADDVARSVEEFSAAAAQAQMIVIPGGFSGGDEPDGSAKLITAFFRSPAVREQVTALLDRRDGLMLGICNGFQALVKLGLVPFGRIVDTDESCPTLTYNVIGRHQSRLVRVRIASNKSPWLAAVNPGQIFTVPISHGEGRFLAAEEQVRRLAENGQIASQYVDAEGLPSMDTAFNPNGSVCAVEGVTSPDGRVFGRMGHVERTGGALYRNVPGEYDQALFASAVQYFR